ncbi:MAG: gliding motility-associated C-terminal domain-containing protein [Raineya sp.]|jgi:hypothetical protein|nr:gliding motility-associated C-terminal domain-containing protein [Raineya sp.]
MKGKMLLIVLFLFLGHLTKALNHIGGGELYITHVSGNTYRIQVIYYYDALNYQNPPNTGIPTDPSPPNIANVSIYRKLNNIRVLNVSLPRISSSFIALPTNVCRDQSIRYNGLERIVYQANVTLSNANFSDVQGYYAIFQDYTRNTGVATNISGRTGISLYAEIPRVFTGSASFINSNPVFTPFTNLYICNGQTSNLDFSATDVDGDVLVYSLVDMYDALPIRRNPPPITLPPPLPNTYPFPPRLVNWDAGFSASNAIPSNVSLPLSINSTTGQITVNPAQKGLYSFVVKCEEYRGGIKIGEVRRDIQLFVDACQSVVNTPIVRMLLPQSTTYYQENTILEIDANNYTENNIILDVEGVIQPDIYRPKPVLFVLTPQNFFNNAPNRIILAPSTSEPNASGVAKTKLRLPECLENNKIYEFRLRVSDQQCPNEGVSEINVKIRFKARSSNLPPRLSITGSFPTGIQNNSVIIVNPKDSININLRAQSIEPRSKDSLEIVIATKNFDIKDYGMEFTDGRKDIISTRASFIWKPDCDLIRSNGQNDTLTVYFLAKRKPSSGCFTATDSIKVKFLLRDTYAHFDEFLPPNTFTPNGDGINDVFVLSNLEPAPPKQPNGIQNPNMPLDNCLFKFEKIIIYNRWGKEVFSSSDRNFVWNGDKQTSGVYYYQIKYSNQKLYKGIINLLR